MFFLTELLFAAHAILPILSQYTFFIVRLVVFLSVVCLLNCAPCLNLLTDLDAIL